MAHAFGYGHGFGFGLGFLDFLGTVLFLVAIVWVARWVLRSNGDGRARWWGGPTRGGRAVDEALRAARERYAAGEVSSEQYAEIRQGLARHEQAARGPWGGDGDGAVRLARMRFARGEIDRDEFDGLMKGLTG